MIRTLGANQWQNRPRSAERRDRAARERRAAAALIGQAIRCFRLERGWTQAELARRAGDFSRKYISWIEHGHVLPLWQTLERLARALGVSLEELVD